MTVQNGKFELVDFKMQAGAALPGADMAYRTPGVPMRWLPNVKRTGIPFATQGMQAMNPVAVAEAAVDFLPAIQV